MKPYGHSVDIGGIEVMTEAKMASLDYVLAKVSASLWSSTYK